MRGRFNPGSISAGAAWFTTTALMLYGGMVLHFMLLLVYAVPCVAAYRKQPARFWRPFTLLSVFLTIGATCVLTFGFVREVDGRIVMGFPVAYDAQDPFGIWAARQLNAVLVSGVCLLPLVAASTIDTFRRSRPPRASKGSTPVA